MPIDAPAPRMPIEPPFAPAATDAVDDHASDSRGDEMMVDPTVLFDAYRRQIEHEDALMNQRVSWLLMSQTFLVMGYCVLHQTASPVARAQPMAGQLTHLLAAVAVIINVPLLITSSTVSSALRGLRDRFAAVCQRRADLQAMLAEYPPLQMTGRRLPLSRTAAVAMPVFFILFWISLIAATWLRRL